MLVRAWTVTTASERSTFGKLMTCQRTPTVRGFAVLAPSRKGEEDTGKVGEEAMSQAVGESQGEEPSHNEPG